MSEIPIDKLDTSVLHLDNLPIVDSFLKRLCVREHIDSACPSRSNANFTHARRCCVRYFQAATLHLVQFIRGELAALRTAFG